MSAEERRKSAAQVVQKSDAVQIPWFRRKKRILLGVLFAAGMTIAGVSLCDHESSMLYLYKQGKVGIQQLSLEDKIRAWKFTAAQGGKCGNNMNKVMYELNDEYFMQMKIGNEAACRKLSELREALIQNQLSRMEQFPECMEGKK